MHTNLTMAKRAAFLLASTLLLAVPAVAIPIYGTVGFSGSRLSSFTLSAGPDGGSYIDFQNPGRWRIRRAFFRAARWVPSTTPISPTSLRAPSRTWPPIRTDWAMPWYLSAGRFQINNYITFSTIPSVNFRLTMLPFASNCGGPVTCGERISTAAEWSERISIDQHTGGDHRWSRHGCILWKHHRAVPEHHCGQCDFRCVDADRGACQLLERSHHFVGNTRARNLCANRRGAAGHRLAPEPERL